MQVLVVVSGLPASGKSTLAQAVAHELGFDHLDKDTFLEALFRDEVVETSQANVALPLCLIPSGDGRRKAASLGRSERRRELSRVADSQFEAQALSRQCAVLSSWWQHPGSTRHSGTAVSWLSAPSLSVIELHCFCPPALAVERFLDRRRHPGHLDNLYTRATLLEQFTQAAGLGPLFPDKAIVCDTAKHVPHSQVVTLAAQIKCSTGGSAVLERTANGEARRSTPR